MTATTLFEMERRSPGDGKQALMYVREKRRPPVAKTAQARKRGTQRRGRVRRRRGREACRDKAAAASRRP